MQRKKVINEIYPAIQGEGMWLGTPTTIIRFVGCTHRCWFGEEGGWCDSWMNSIHPEQALYNINEAIRKAELINHEHVMITGGSPTMHIDELRYLVEGLKENGHKITIETEGSFTLHHKITGLVDLISLSPKFENSVPKLGIKTPKGKVVDQKFIDQHNKYRGNIDVMKKLIRQGLDYQLKPVWDGNKETLQPILNMIKELDIPKNKVYFMPAGDTREKLIQTYPKVMEFCTSKGYNFTPRPHIIAFDNKRFV